MSMGDGAVHPSCSCESPSTDGLGLLAADAKFPGQHGGGLPPSPSRENPGQVRMHVQNDSQHSLMGSEQVFPQSDPKGE